MEESGADGEGGEYWMVDNEKAWVRGKVEDVYGLEVPDSVFCNAVQ